MKSHPDSQWAISGQKALADYVGALLETDVASAGSNVDDIAGYDSAPLVPQWGKGNFECLMVIVGSISLAIPAEKVLGTMAWEYSSSDSTVPVLDTLVSPDGQMVTVIDVARIVLPRDQWPQDRGADNGGMHPLVLVARGQFGLLVDSLKGDKTIASREVTWRSAKTRRTWLAGTSKAQACAVLDVDALLRLMDSTL